MGRIYTRTGDGGMTSLYDGQRIPKFKARMMVVGTLDELNANIGLALSEIKDEDMRQPLLVIQNILFNIGAEVAEGGTKSKRMIPDEVRVTEGQDVQLEKWIDSFEQEAPPMTGFILPGGSRPGALLHVARTVCRRAERHMALLSEEESMNPNSLKFINRLSDFLYVAARAVNARAGVPEPDWEKEL